MKPNFLNKISFGYFLVSLFLISSFLFVSSCSQHSNSVASKTYHNTTARYNAYFLARERMKEVEKKIKEGNIDDYNRILKVYPIVTEAVKGGIKPDLDYIIEKAALPVNKHQNSDWVDDSYNLIGKSRLYEKDYKLAIQTFKYVNTKGEDKDAKHLAMILLMRTFLDTIQIENAGAVHEYLSKEKITSKNAADYHLTEAAYFHYLEEFEKVRLHLEKALPHIQLREDKARVHFIIGQIFQLQGKNQEAYKNYESVFKNNPPYELFFFARLYLAQVSDLADVSDKKKIDKYFKKLLKDQKNLEYRDKIYYEMGKYELKQNNLPVAITHFEKSLRENKTNTFQKARTYLALGQIYYDNLKKYSLSKLYYDSTVATWDQQDKEYKPLADRQKILAEFVKYVEIVEREDSLQRLAKMSSVDLDKFVTKLIVDKAKKEQELALKKAKEEEKRKREEEFLANNQADNQQMPMPRPMSMEQEWYFYNLTTINQGKADFLKKWGKRPLEDNWRRSKKQSEIPFEQETQKEELIVDKDQQKKDSVIAMEAEKQALISAIPNTPELLDSSNARIEDGLYNIGKIYNFKLNEKTNSIETFNKLLARYPSTELKPEIYYLLYLIYKNQNSNEQVVYKDKLHNEFPTSLYSKLVNNPNYLAESKILNQEAAEMYKTAFDLYKSGDFITSDSVLSQIKGKYPDNNIQDKLALLSILNKGQTLSAVVYKEQLNKFIADYASSPLVEKAKELLTSTDNYIAKQNEKGVAVAQEVKFIKNFEKPHMFVALVKNDKASLERIKEELSRYNKLKGFTVSIPEVKDFSDSTIAIYVSGFSNKQSARTYLDNCEKESVLKKYASLSQFIISNDNFKILEGSGNTKAYLKFFKMNYHETLLYGE